VDGAALGGVIPVEGVNEAVAVHGWEECVGGFFVLLEDLYPGDEFVGEGEAYWVLFLSVFEWIGTCL
jgi:hypothetical protein